MTAYATRCRFFRKVILKLAAARLTARAFPRFSPPICDALCFHAHSPDRVPCRPGGCAGWARRNEGGASTRVRTRLGMNLSWAVVQRNPGALLQLRSRRCGAPGAMLACCHRPGERRVASWPGNARPPHNWKRAEDDKSPAASFPDCAAHGTQAAGARRRAVPPRLPTPTPRLQGERRRGRTGHENRERSWVAAAANGATAATQFTP
ncbi:MAG: hypothetical protein QOG27_66 [Verrucomicrobiota bacterium]